MILDIVKKTVGTNVTLNTINFGDFFEVNDKLYLKIKDGSSQNYLCENITDKQDVEIISTKIVTQVKKINITYEL